MNKMIRPFARRRIHDRPLRIEPLEARQLLAAHPIISEFLASNDDSLLDEDNRSADWIELSNAGDQPIDLAGWHLTDNPANLDKWTFPSTLLAPGQYLIVFASGKDRAIPGQPLHTDFELSDDGEYLALVQPDGITVVSQFGSAFENYPEQLSDLSYGVRDSGSAPLILSSSTGPTSYFVPADDALGASWTEPAFDDGAFSSGPGPIGFEHLAGESGPAPLTEYAWSVLRDNPRFYWNFDEASGPAADLVRGQANDHLSPSASATRVAHAEMGSGLHLGRAASLDGASAFAATALNDLQMPGPWAIEFWVQAQGAQITPAGSSGARNDYLLNFGGDGTTGGDNPSVYFDNSSAGADNKIELFRINRTGANGPSLDDTNWHHVVLAFYGNGTTIGVANRTDVVLDGVVAGNVADGNFSANMGLSGALTVGARFATGASGFEGRIDEVALYDLSGLSVSEVTSKVGTLAGHYALATTAAVDSPLQCIAPASYAYSTAPGGNPAYEDAALAKLKDGVIGSTLAGNIGSGERAGWNTVDPIITFDLGESYDLSSVLIDFDVSHAAGVHAPDSVTVEFSDNGATFGSPVASTNFNDFGGSASVGWNRRQSIDVTGRTARYVRLTFANTDAWTFLSEVRFSGSQVGESGRGCTAASSTASVDLVGYWDFNDRTADLSGSGNDAVLEGATYDADVPLALAGGKSVQFTAVDGEFVEVPDAPELRLNDKFTLSAWMKSTNLNQSQVYLISRNTAYANPYGAPSKQYAVIYEYVDNRVEFFGPSLISGSDPRPGSQVPIADANWHHVAYTYDGQTWSGFVDGTVVFSTPRTFALDNTFASSWFFGTANPDVGFYSGFLDDIAMWNGALSPEQVAALAAGSSPLSLFGYDPIIATDIESSLYGINAGLFTRQECQLSDPATVTSLTLRTRYEDGFVAYLNGVKVAEDNAPVTPAWNSTATAERPAADAVTPREFDLTAFRTALRSGANVLAIHGLNLSATDDDFLLSSELTATTQLQLLSNVSYFATPTPGGPNGPGAGEPGPRIVDVSQPAGAIADGDDLVVTARVQDVVSAVAAVTLTYRANYSAETTTAMRDDGSGADAAPGDGVYTAVIPAAASSPGQMIRYNVRAVDAANRSSRAPFYIDPTGSPEYYGTVVADPAVVSQLPIFQWFLAPGTDAAADTRSGTRAALFYRDTLYDNIFVRLRGRSINSTGKFAYKFDFNQHHHFVYDPNQPAVEELDLGSTGLDKSYVRPIIGFELFRDAGADYSTTFPMRIQRNGQFFSVGWFIENPDEDYLARNGLDPEGAFYKANLNGFTTAAQGGYRTVFEGWDKKTRLWENNADIVQFTAGVELTGQALVNFLYDNVNIAAQINYMAAEALLQDADRLVNNFYAYRDSDGAGLWHMLVWDLDLALGQFQVASDVIHADDDYPAGVSHPFHGIQSKPDFRNPSLWNNLLTKIIATPSLREMFLRRLRTLMDEFLKPIGTPAVDLYFERRMDELFAQMSADVILDKARWGNRYGAAETFQQSLDRLKSEYFAVRRTHLFVTHGIDNVGGGDNTTLISGTPGDTTVSYFVPTDNALGTSWTAREFTPAAPWPTGALGIGYENQSAEYDSLLETNVRPQDACATCTSILIRIPFNVTDASAISQLTLQMKYDDGFVAYLNGQEVARRGVSGTPGFDTVAADHPDTAALAYENIPIAATSLVTGQNVLAIRAINSSATASSDMLLLPQLVTGTVSSGDAAGVPHAQIGNPSIAFGQIEFNPASGNQDEEFIELRNSSSAAADISLWTLTGGVTHTFAAGTVIPAGGSLYVTPSFTAFRARTTGPRGGQGLFVQGDYQGHLSSFGETIDLTARDGSVVASITTPNVPSDAQRFLRITELQYHPAGPTQAERNAGFDDGDLFEYAELHNISDTTTLDLEGVQFTDGVSFTFGQVSLPPGGYGVVVSNQLAFQARYGTTISVFGEYVGNLANGGESVQLDDADGGSIHDFTFDDNGSTWHPTTDGEGFSLVILAPLGNLDDWGDGAKWRPSFERDGSPGERDQMLGDFDADQDVDLLDLAYLQSRLDVNGPATSLTGDLTRNGIVNREDAARFVLNFGRSYQPPAIAPGASMARSPAIIVEANPAAIRIQATRRTGRNPAATDQAISSAHLLALETARATPLLAQSVRFLAKSKIWPSA